MSKPRIVIGLTGGIGGGKSFVASCFRKLGARVIDADKIVHALLKQEGTLARIRKEWGDAVINEDGSLNRRRMARVVFDDPDELKKLTDILHPQVRKEMKADLDRSKTGLVVIDAPLLLETGLDEWCDALVHISVQRKTRYARVKKSRGWSAKEFDEREARQISEAQKRKKAKYIVSNGSSMRQTRADVKRLVEKLLA